MSRGQTGVLLDKISRGGLIMEELTGKLAAYTQQLEQVTVYDVLCLDVVISFVIL